jgi:hypothetical protein
LAGAAGKARRQSLRAPQCAGFAAFFRLAKGVAPWLAPSFAGAAVVRGAPRQAGQPALAAIGAEAWPMPGLGWKPAIHAASCMPGKWIQNNIFGMKIEGCALDKPAL